MNDHELDEALAAAAPVHDRDLRSPATRAAVMAEMEEIVTMQATPERDELHLPNQRTPRVLFAVASVAAAIALVGMLAWAPADDPDGGDEVAGTAPESSETPETTDDLEVHIISATRAALADSIMLQTQVDVSGHVTQMWSDEATGAMRIAMTGSDGGEVMFDHGLADPTDPSIVRQVDHCFAEYTEGERWGPDSRGEPGHVSDGPSEGRNEAEVIRGWLESGDVVEDGTEAFEGREAIRLVWTVEERTMLVDTETYRPLQVLGYPGTEWEYTQTYEFLERTDDHLALLVPPVPDGFTRVDQLRGDGERLAAGCD